jgi:hypothetical protein
LPPLEALHQELKSEGFSEVAILTWVRGGTGSRVKLYEERYGTTFPFLYVPNGGAPWGYAVRGTPSLALHDRKGRVVAWKTGGGCDMGGLREPIRALLADVQ